MDKLIINEESIKNKIYTIRGIQVMLDRDLAELYGVKPIRLREQVKRNIKRFPEDFRFQLTKEEYEYLLRSQFVTLKENLNEDMRGKHRKYLPYVFTEQGVSMLSAILKSDIAIEISIKIIETFVAMRKHLASNSLMFERFERIEQRLSVHDEKFDTIFKTLENKSIKPTQGIFYDGQIFDN